jgi:hypothetical protein
VSPNDGASWQKLQLNLPIVPVHDLTIKEGDLIAATHGRSFWVIDDLSPLRQLTSAVTAQDAHLFKPRDAYRVSFSGRGGGGGGAGAGAAAGPPVHPVATSPSGGPVVFYWLKRPNRTVTVEFLDAKGTLIRSFTSRQDSVTAADSVAREKRQRSTIDSLRAAGIAVDSAERMVRRSAEAARAEGQPSGGEDEDGPRRTPPPARAPNKAGINSFAWNMRYPDASSFEGLIMWAAGTQGPVAPPGTYQVRLLVDGAPVATEQFALKKDPRSTATPADYAAQFAFLEQVRERTSQANDAVKTIRWVRAELADREKKLNGSALTEFRALAAPLRAEIAVVEDSIYQTKNRSGQDPLNYPIRLNNKIAALAGVAGSAEARPTDQTVAVFRTLSTQLDGELAKMKRALDASLPKINSVLKANGQPEVVPRAVDLVVPRPDIVMDDDDDGP